MNRGSGAQSWQENAGVDRAGRLQTGKSFALQGAEKTDWDRREWLEVLAVSRYAKFQTNRFPGGTLITRKMTRKLSYRRAQTLTANKEGHHYISENNLGDSCDTTALKHNELCHSGQVQRGQPEQEAVLSGKQCQPGSSTWDGKKVREREKTQTQPYSTITFIICVLLQWLIPSRHSWRSWISFPFPVMSRHKFQREKYISDRNPVSNSSTFSRQLSLRACGAISICNKDVWCNTYPWYVVSLQCTVLS